MRTRRRSVPWGMKLLGSLVIIVVPLMLVGVLRAHMAAHGLVTYLGWFLVLSIAAQIGLILRRWGNITVGKVVFNIGLAVAAAVVSWLVVSIALKRGGGPVDPSVVALILAYLLTVWSG